MLKAWLKSLTFRTHSPTSVGKNYAKLVLSINFGGAPDEPLAPPVWLSVCLSWSAVSQPGPPSYKYSPWPSSGSPPWKPCRCATPRGHCRANGWSSSSARYADASPSHCVSAAAPHHPPFRRSFWMSAGGTSMTTSWRKKRRSSETSGGNVANRRFLWSVCWTTAAAKPGRGRRSCAAAGSRCADVEALAAAPPVAVAGSPQPVRAKGRGERDSGQPSPHQFLPLWIRRRRKKTVKRFHLTIKCVGRTSSWPKVFLVLASHLWASNSQIHK